VDGSEEGESHPGEPPGSSAGSAKARKRLPVGRTIMRRSEEHARGGTVSPPERGQGGAEFRGARGERIAWFR